MIVELEVDEYEAEWGLPGRPDVTVSAGFYLRPGEEDWVPQRAQQIFLQLTERWPKKARESFVLRRLAKCEYPTAGRLRSKRKRQSLES